MEAIKEPKKYRVRRIGIYNPEDTKVMIENLSFIQAQRHLSLSKRSARYSLIMEPQTT